MTGCRWLKAWFSGLNVRLKSRGGDGRGLGWVRGGRGVGGGGGGALRNDDHLLWAGLRGHLRVLLCAHCCRCGREKRYTRRIGAAYEQASWVVFLRSLKEYLCRRRSTPTPLLSIPLCEEVVYMCALCQLGIMVCFYLPRELHKLNSLSDSLSSLPDITEMVDWV